MAPAIQALKMPDLTKYKDLSTANLAARADFKNDPDGYHNLIPPKPYLEMLNG